MLEENIDRRAFLGVGIAATAVAITSCNNTSTTAGELSASDPIARSSKLVQFINANKIPATLTRIAAHDSPALTQVAHLSQALKASPTQVLKSMLVWVDTLVKGRAAGKPQVSRRLFHVLVPGDKKVSTGAIKHQLNAHFVRVVGQDTKSVAQKKIGYLLTHIPPISHALPTLVDPALKSAGTIHFNGGTPELAVSMLATDLINELEKRHELVWSRVSLMKV